MSLRKLPSGRWEARERTGGRGSRRLAKTFDFKRDAEKWAANVRRQRQLGRIPLEEQRRTFDELVETYWELHAIPNLAASTSASYLSLWKVHVSPRLGSRDVRELTPEVLTRFRADLERAGVGTATVRKALAFIQSVLSFAVVEELLDVNPASAVRKPRYERARAPMIFGPTEVELIRARLEPRDQALVAVLAYAGPRPEEALRLTWADVGAETLHFRDTKRHRDRWTPLLAPLAADLRLWRLASGARATAAAPVFPRSDGGHWREEDWRNWRRRTWRTVAPAGSRPRDLRSSYITVMVYSGQPLSTVAKWAGTSVAMLDKRYAAVLAEWDGRTVPAEEQLVAVRTPKETV